MICVESNLNSPWICVFDVGENCYPELIGEISTPNYDYYFSILILYYYHYILIILIE